MLNPVARSTPQAVESLSRAVETFDEARCRELAARFVADNVWHCPTLIRQRTGDFASSARYARAPGLRHIAPRTLRLWRGAGKRFAGLPEASRSTFQQVYALQLRIARIFDEAGLRMLTGTDVTGAAWVVPGVSLHEEFDELAAAGLAPLRIPRMATLNGAEFLRRTDTMGSVEVGKDADLVLLDRDPVERVGHLHGIAGVVRAGRYLAAGDLAALKDGIAADRSVR